MRIVKIIDKPMKSNEEGDWQVYAQLQVGNTYQYGVLLIGRRLLYCCNDDASIWANGLIDAPTISQVLKWLREEKNIHISTTPYIDKDYELKWLYNVIIIKVSDVCTFTEKQGRDFTSSDEASIAGIEYTLDHLI